jgi:polyphosphate kinase
MIRRIFQLPIARLLLYYVGLVAVTLLLVRLFPILGLALHPVDTPSGFEFLGGGRSVAAEEAARGFLDDPHVELRTLLALMGSLALVLPIAWVYMVTRRESRYDQALVHTLVMLPIAVTGIVVIVQSSLALAFSLAGIVAAVRFRNTLQDTKDAVYVFLAIGIGLAGGVQVLPVALIVSGVFNVVILFLWQFEIGNIYGPTKQVTAAVTATHAIEDLAKLPSRKRGSAMFDASKLIGKVEEAPVTDTGAPVLNPELSLLEFNARVLALAEDPKVPPLARVRFLSIFSSNLDEFFMVRVGGLKQAVAEGITKRSIDGQTPAVLLQSIHVKLRALVRRQYRCLQELRDGELEAACIRIRPLESLDEAGREYLRDYFDERILPLLTPKAITLAGGHPFPFIDDLLLSLAVVVRDPRTERDHFVNLEVLDAIPRFVQLPGSFDFVPVEDAIRANIGLVYPGRQVLEVHPFRIIRSAEIKFDEKNAANFLEAMEDELRRRPSGAIVRIEVERSMPFPIRDLLLRELRREEDNKGIPLQASDLQEVDGLVDLGSLDEIADITRPELDYPPYQPAEPVDPDESMFTVLARGDLLVHHPYESFAATTQRFLLEAAKDPDVVAIKLTLYRPGGPSALADALTESAQHGKDISVFVEVKARFDEELNILWAKQLERGGIHVVTGLVKYKTHAKLALVVRREGDRIRRYAHIGTGNYNPQTGRQYTDFGLLTSDEEICADVSLLFNELTGSSRPPAADFTQLLVAPTNMIPRFLGLINREVEHARAGRPAGIRVKLNGLSDGEIVEALYRASQAGVAVEAVVRGICALRPGVPGLSDGIRIVAAVGRFLEHGRLFRFENGGDPDYYTGSADWRPRNLRRRVEVVAPVADPGARQRIDEILETELTDPGAWELQRDGSYVQRGGEQAGASGRAQDIFLTRHGCLAVTPVTQAAVT